MGELIHTGKESILKHLVGEMGEVGQGSLLQNREDRT